MDDNNIIFLKREINYYKYFMEYLCQIFAQLNDFI